MNTYECLKSPRPGHKSSPNICSYYFAIHKRQRILKRCIIRPSSSRGAMLSRGEGREEVKDDTCLRLERVLPRVVITLAHPVREASPNISPTKAKRKCEELAQGSKDELRDRQNVVRKLVAALENRGKYPPLSFTELPSLIFRQILEFLPHSALLNFSLTNSSLHFLVMHEWQTNPSLWRHVTLAPSLAPSKLLSLKNALQQKRRFIRSIRLT